MTNHCIWMASAIALAAALPASAQESAPAARPAGGLEDIVVTATRREERLQDVPVTVSAITGQALASADVSTVRTLTQVVPGFMGSRFVGAFQPVIRGVGSSGLGVGDEANVAIYIDGVYQPESLGNWIDLVEVERVEVLRGPQGTVFGRNATGGLINILTPDPGFETRGKLALRYGRMRNSAEDVDVRLYATGPIAADRLAADFAVLYRKNDGYLKDLVRGGTLGDMEVANIRSKLMWTPGERSKIILTGEYFHQGSTSNAPQPADNNTAGRRFPGVILPSGPWEVSLNQIPILDMTRANVSLRTQFEFDGFNLETTTGYQDLDWNQSTDQDASNILLGELPAWMYSKTISQEVRLLSTGDHRLNWIVGGYFFDFDGNADFYVTTSPAPGIPVTSPHFQPELATRSYSGFAEGTLELTDTLFLTAGGRYTKEKRSFRQRVNGRYVFDRADQWFDKWTYRAALRWQFAPEANIYASYGTGFKSGVYNMFSTIAAAVNPETIEAVEGGIKADPLPWLRTNLSIYHYTYDDLQVQVKSPTGPGGILQNAANAEIYGGEFELTANPVAGLLLRGNAAYAHARYKDFPGAQSFAPRADGGNDPVAIDASGNQMMRAPEWTFNVGFDWGHDFSGGRLGVSANLFHSATVYYDFLNVFAQKPYTLTNGQISWTTADQAWRFSLWANNLTNEKVYQTLRPGTLGTDTFYEQPRKIGIGAELRF